MAAMTVKLGHYIWDMTSAMTLDRITQTDQSGQVGPTGQPGQLRQDGMPGPDNNDQSLGQVSCEQEQDSWKRNQAGQDKGQGR